ncbi:hypothetical protein BT96DRAFT_949467 [Gymnopus androsaceus JB14]|uniref:Uncharacterized protein n=1 Tax=Gymnopus androsaceus JB14 TaxID=1447944 RepID=A0A6A4GKT5_9AGAR|nr:hypothetical protein BT96DRAFT_949467 [Gymnopus androsaceus JB14]
MSNTSRFNRRVQALQASKRSSVSSSRRQRVPAHGLQGDANSQRKSGSRGTSSFCHSQVQKMQEKGAAAEVRVLAYDLPEVAAAQEYPPARTDEPMPYAAPYGELLMHTDASNKSWEEQREGMVDAYMDWCIKKTTGEVLPLCDKPSLWVDVVDVFVCHRPLEVVSKRALDVAVLDSQFNRSNQLSCTPEGYDDDGDDDDDDDGDDDDDDDGDDDDDDDDDGDSDDDDGDGDDDDGESFHNVG